MVRQTYINLLNWFRPNFQKGDYFMKRVLEGESQRRETVLLGLVR